MGGFQTQSYYNPAPGVEGDFASTNPRATVIAGPGGLVCGDAGVIVGRFGWTTQQFTDADGSPAVVNNFGAGPVAGFVHREQQGLILNYLEESSMLVPAGFPITLFSEGDFWVKNNGATQALPGMKAYASFADGKASAAATGTPAGATATSGIIAAATGIAVTGSIAGNVLTVTAVGAGTVVPGAIIAGSGVATGTQIVSQLSGTAGGIGTYAVSIPEQTVASTAITGTYGILTLAGTIAGTWGAGQVVAGSNVTAGTTIWSQLTGTAGAAGTYVVSPSQSAADAAVTSVTNVETKWYVRSSALPGELMKISAWPQG